MGRVSLRAVVLAAAAIILAWVLFLAARTFLSWEKSNTPTKDQNSTPVPILPADKSPQPGY
jgi:hypothetical protein